MPGTDTITDYVSPAARRHADMFAQQQAEAAAEPPVPAPETRAQLDALPYRDRTRVYLNDRDRYDQLMRQ